MNSLGAMKHKLQFLQLLLVEITSVLKEPRTSWEICIWEVGQGAVFETLVHVVIENEMSLSGEMFSLTIYLFIYLLI